MPYGRITPAIPENRQKGDTDAVSAFVYGAEDDVTASTKESAQLQEVSSSFRYL
jgi:hypothetical protein